MDKPKLYLFVVCDKAFFDKRTGKLNIEGEFNNINASNSPAVHEKMSVVIGLIGINDGAHETFLTIKNKETSKEISKVQIEFNKTNNTKRHRIIFNLQNIPFPDFGEYVFDFKIDNVSIDVLNSIFLTRDV